MSIKQRFSVFFLSLVTFLATSKRLLMNKHHIYVSEMLVSGNESVEIKLDFRPTNIEVEFLPDTNNHHPCNHPEPDSLFFSLHKERHSHEHLTVLTVVWNVANTRIVSIKASE